jgi:hypothetical protein
MFRALALALLLALAPGSVQALTILDASKP